MVSVSHLDDHALEELQNATYVERLQRMEKIRRAGDSAQCQTARVRDRGMSDLSGASMRLPGEATTQGPTTPAMPLSLDNVEDVFRFHAWSRDQVDAGAQVVDALIAAAKVILRVVPPSADRAVALRKIREARMDANSAITHRGRF